MQELFRIFATIIINAGIANGFIFTALLYKRNRNYSNFLLSLVLIEISLLIFNTHYLMHFLFINFGFLFFGVGPTTFLLGPLIFFYIRSIAKPGTRISKKDMGHFVLFFTFILLVLPIYFLGKDGAYAAFLKLAIGSPFIFLVIQLGYYLKKARELLLEHQKNIQEGFSNVEDLDLSWLKFILSVFIVIVIFIAIGTPGIIHGVDIPTYKTANAIFFSLVLFFIGYRGLQQKIPEENLTRNQVNPPSELASINKRKEELFLYMESKKPFLNPELTLIDLADEVGMSRNQLSEVINSGTGNNFYYFINNYRVEEIKRLIKEDTKKKYTLLALANEAGFNSKSTFNSIFKKVTGLTPSRYREGLQ